MITGSAERLAACLAGSQKTLSEKAAVGVVTVRQLEAGLHVPRRATLDVIRRAFEAAGVEFIIGDDGGKGVRARKPGPPPG